MAVCLGAQGLAYWQTQASVPVATTAALLASTSIAMHARLSWGRWRAAALVVAGAGVLAVLQAPPRLVGAVLVTALVAAELVARRSRRASVLQAGVWTGAVAGIVGVSGILATVSLPPGVAAREALGAVLGAVLSGPLILAAGPIAEWLFGHTTPLTMSEWLSYEHPLLRELATNAPGTFLHSVNVALLVDAATLAVKGDALLARVGALYHDVGKSRAPLYFVENQRDSNPHDGLPPWESARYLRQHVTDGVALVRAHRMGERIADFVREHHGTGQMRSLSETAARLDGGPEVEETYRYAGPKPQSRETAILMVADQVEATARSAAPDDEAAAHALVRRTIDRILGEGQLEESGMTDEDLEKVQVALERTVQAMYHRRRLAYPPTEAPAPPPSRLPFSRRNLRRRRAAS